MLYFHFCLRKEVESLFFFLLSILTHSPWLNSVRTFANTASTFHVCLTFGIVMTIFIFSIIWYQGVTCQLQPERGTRYPDLEPDFDFKKFQPGENVLVECVRHFWFSFSDPRTKKTINCTESGEWDTAATCYGRQHCFHLLIVWIVRISWSCFVLRVWSTTGIQPCNNPE